ncbi:DUF3854 domain-containing protein [Fictibacillus phosphorivorans]|nr:DUF3854 domain-containing protein [Fictibacillus phosphorivorans]
MRKTKLKGWYEYYRTPCIICGSTGACMIHKDGNAVVCIRIESDKSFSKNSALPSYLHKLTGDKKQKIDETEVPEYECNQKQNAHNLNEAYGVFLDCLELNEEHYQHLTSDERQLSDQQVAIREYRSFPEKPWEVTRMMKEELDCDGFTGIPGFYLKDNKYWTIAGANGILIPFRNHYNQVVGFQYRIDKPLNVVDVKVRKQGLKARVKEQPNLVQVTYDGEIIFEERMELTKEFVTIKHEEDIMGWVRLAKGNRYYWLSSANKPEGTGSGDPAPIHISVPTSKLKDWKPGTVHKAKTVWLSEGPLKCDIAADCIEKLYDPLEIEEIGETFLALPGVGAWRLAIPIMKEMGVEQVNLCFDADAVSNRHVKSHLMECAKELKQQGFRGNLILWSEKDGKGIDDVFLNSKIPHIKKMF